MSVQTIESTESFGPQVERAIEAQRYWLDPVGETIQNGISGLLAAGGPAARRAKDFLNGTWLGHPMHAAISDVPIGAWGTGLILDFLGMKRGADAAIAAGVVGALPTAMAGLADWHDLLGSQRRTGVVHGLFNSLALGCYVGSLLARRSGNRTLGVGLSTVGFGLAFGGAYLGGELVYKMGTNVNRTAWDLVADGFHVAARASDLRDGQLTAAEIDVDGTRVPIVLLKRGDEILALNGKCAHEAGPLAEGKLVDEYCVVCPWHGSTFDMRTGEVIHGPSAYPQPRFEARVREGNVEVRLAR